MKFKRPESLIVAAIMTLVLLPVRLIFYTFVSNSWFGSFGVVTVISVAMIVLIKKKKLGWFGDMFERQMIKVQTSKRKYLAYGFLIFNILLTAGFITATNMGNTVFSHDKNDLVYGIKNMNNGNMITMQDSLNSYKTIPTPSIVKGLLTLIDIALFHPSVFAGFMAIMNDVSNGYYLHFATVLFVQELESLGILLLYRRVFVKGETVH